MKKIYMVQEFNNYIRALAAAEQFDSEPGS
jgi:hypothetical protein